MMRSADGTEKVGVALIGAGMIAPTHVAAVSAQSDRARLKTIISRRPERAVYLAEHCSDERPEFTSDLSSVAEDPEIDMVIVATPPSVRIELIDRLAKAGKHVLLEKPVARNPDEARAVVECCESAGVTLGVLFQHRMRATSRAAAQRIAEGGFGKPGMVEIAVSLWRDQSYYDEPGRGTFERDGGGVLITQAIHTIDLALSLTGPVASVQAMTATTPLHNMEAEDFAVAGLRFASGAVGSLVANTATFPAGKETVTLHFENGSLRLAGDNLEVSWRDGRSETIASTDEAAGENGPMLANHALHQAVIEDFIGAIREGRAPMVTGRQALASHALIHAIETSSRSGAPVALG